MVKIVTDNMEKVLIDPALIINGKDGKDGERGPEGLPGRDGLDGRNGLDGKDGRDGKDGKNGISYWIEYDKKKSELVFKNDGGKKNPAPIKLPESKGWGFGAGGGRGGVTAQSDWNQTDPHAVDYIKNKPEVHNVQLRRVDELPDTGEPYVLYLVPLETAEENNIYEEYIWAIQSDESYAFEKLGTTEVDLSGYVKSVNNISPDSNGNVSLSFPVQDVQVNGTSITTSGVANIPKASNSTLGVVQTNGSYGIEISPNGYIATIPAAEATLVAKLNGRNVVAANNLDIAVREGLGNNSLTWTEAYKTSARNTIGAEAQATIQALSATDSITLADNTIYNGGEQTALTIALPATVDVSFLCEIDFTSGATETTLAYPNSIKWVGDDVANNVFIPVASKRYTIICAYDGVNYRFTVKGV